MRKENQNYNELPSPSSIIINIQNQIKIKNAEDLKRKSPYT